MTSVEQAMWTIEGCEVKGLTRELAREYAQMRSVEFERHLKPARQKGLTRKIKNKLLIQFNWAVAYVESEKDWFRVNGQHSSKTLVSLSDEIFPEGIPVCMTKFRVKDRRALAILFMQQDSRASARGLDDLHFINLRNNPELDDVHPKIAAKLVKAVSSYKFKVEKVYESCPNSDDELMEYYHKELHPFFLGFQKLFHRFNLQIFQAGFMRAIYGSWLSYGEEGLNFWKNALDSPNGEEGNFIKAIERKEFASADSLYEECDKFYKRMNK